MSIHYLTQKQGIHTTKISSSSQPLRPGQIVQGKILKLYPGNKAKIQLGTQKMVAQLEASLSIGSRYHFQVQKAEDVIHLKVIGEQLKNQPGINIMNLMRQLGLKATKANIAFMQTLISGDIPFTKEQLRRALMLLDKTNYKSQASVIIKEMVAARLPLTDSVFQALSARNTSGFSEQIGQLTNQLRQHSSPSALHSRLLGQLNQIGGSPVNTVMQTLSKDETLFNVMKISGVFESDAEFSAWRLEKGTISNGNLPGTFQSASSKALGQLEHLQQNKAAIQSAARLLLNRWIPLLQSGNVTAQEFSRLTEQINKDLMPHLSGEQNQNLSRVVKNNPHQLGTLAHVLRGLASNNLYTDANELLSAMKTVEVFTSMPPKEQFLNHMQQVIRVTGLNYENLIAEGSVERQSNTIKSMLIQMIQQGDGATTEQARQLLNFINGMQIQSVNESADFLQASLQLPAEKLGLPGDIQLDFESKKTEDGKINPDFCRILFYLDLSNLKETIIDMSIQKRNVTVTIYNDQGGIASIAQSFRPLLKEGLDELDYQLSTVAIKPLNESRQTVSSRAKHAYQNLYQGVDYRV